MLSAAARPIRRAAPVIRAILGKVGEREDWDWFMIAQGWKPAMEVSGGSCASKKECFPDINRAMSVGLPS